MFVYMSCGSKSCLMVLAVLCVFGLYFKFKKSEAAAAAACATCFCHCTHPQSLLELVPGLPNLTIKDCGKDYPDLKDEMEKQFDDLLSEELRLQETVGNHQLQHMNVALGEARKMASQYEKEAEKCNAATETCEGARERAESLLIKERKITLVWQRRAKLLGWE